MEHRRISTTAMTVKTTSDNTTKVLSGPYDRTQLRHGLGLSHAWELLQRYLKELFGD